MKGTAHKEGRIKHAQKGGRGELSMCRREGGGGGERGRGAGKGSGEGERVWIVPLVPDSNTVILHHKFSSPRLYPGGSKWRMHTPWVRSAESNKTVVSTC
jgi:hypothetical protein